MQCVFCFQGNVLNMVQDICDSLLWVRERGQTFNLDKVSVKLQSTVNFTNL